MILHLIARVSLMLGALALVAACAPTEWDGGPGGPVIARNTPRPVPSPRAKPHLKRTVKPPVKQVLPQHSRSKSRSTMPVAPARITVSKGDTVYGLARRHGVSPRAIVDANRLRPPYRLVVGQKLRLPKARRYKVRRGDTGYAISRRFGVDLTELMRLNHLRKPFTLSVGQSLRLPVGKPPKSGPPPAAKGFRWPVKGVILSRFGAKKGGLHNDGINIGVTLRQPVRAAERGVVAYAGHDLKGFGNLLLVHHAGGWITAYAHNDRLLVAKGERVKKGQIIARAGSTGSVATPQLHFEMRKGTRAVDPLRHLPRLQASLAGSNRRLP